MSPMAAKLFFSVVVVVLLLSCEVGVEASTNGPGNVSYKFRPKKLFIFGDSYVDTGNGAISRADSWKVPYGITFPGKPVGRYSDGRVFTDFLAKYLGLKTPVAYQWRKTAADGKKYGVNFATGGSGVFDTVQLVKGPNMTTQIDQFINLLINKEMKKIMYTKKDLGSSLALFALSGNDYLSYLITHNASTVGIQTLIPQVVNQLAANLKRVEALGVGKVAVTLLQPIGCLPGVTYTANFTQCSNNFDQLVALHNTLVHQAVAKLNNQTQPPNYYSSFVIIDLYTAFNSVIHSNAKFKTPLVPCCMGVNANYSCGSVDSESGEKKYSLCPNPRSALFWDTVHPTQEGWRAIFSKLSFPLTLIN